MSLKFLESAEVSFFFYIAVFVGCLLIFEGLRQLLSREESKDQAVNRRMRMINRGAKPEDIEAAILGANRSLGDQRFSARFSRILNQAGFSIGFYRFLIGTVAFSFLLFVLGAQVLPPSTSLIMSIMIGLFMPFLIVVSIRSRRMAKLTAQLPDALDLMARGLEVGHPLSVTVGSVATDMPDPIGSEFGMIQDQVSFGDDIKDAFADFADRVDVEDVRYTAVSVGIQHGTGGNLGHVLRVLAKVIRDRMMMRKKIKAISAEGRISASILSIVPFIMIMIVNLLTPSFYGDVMGDPAFIYLAVGSLVLILLQALILFRMVSFKF